MTGERRLSNTTRRRHEAVTIFWRTDNAERNPRMLPSMPRAGGAGSSRAEARAVGFDGLRLQAECIVEQADETLDVVGAERAADAQFAE